MDEFEREVRARIAANSDNRLLRDAASTFMRESIAAKYSYNFSALGRPIIQYPQDIVALQEIIWRVQPDLIIETGIAHGGSLILSASMLALLDLCDGVASGKSVDPSTPKRRALGIDIDIRPPNRAAIESHPMANRIELVEGSSIAAEIVAYVSKKSADARRVLVCLDSNHTEDHVFAELNAYAPLVSKGSYCVVFDSIVEDLPKNTYSDRPWGKGNNPKTALLRFLQSLQGNERIASDGDPLNFEIDDAMESKLMLTVAPSGYLRRTAARR
jgi:cephalosporin hydroxylase